MKRYFNINYEFDPCKVDEIILEHISHKKPGYVCSLDGNNLATSSINPDHRHILNEAIVNNCDSAWIPLIINLIYGTNFSNYCGTDLFIKFVKMKKFRQLFLGSTVNVLEKLQENLSKVDPLIKNMRFESLPFKKVEDFDYKKIGNIINDDCPDIIWVSMGAPKQEKFMSLLLPHINKGIMFGIGAILNVYAEMPGLKRAPQFMVKLKLEWLFRFFQEPKKQISRAYFFISLLPSMIKEELEYKKEKRAHI